MSIFCLKPSAEATTYCPTIINARDFIAECHECGGTYIKHEFEEVDLILEGKKIPPDNLLCGH